MRKETKAIITELKNLVGDAKKNIFRRCQLVSQLFQPENRDWIGEEPINGDEKLAKDHAQKEYFPDLGGFVRLPRLIAIYEAFPDESKWREYRYDLKSMLVLLEQREGEGKQQDDSSPRRRATVAMIEERDRMIEELRTAVSERDKQLSERALQLVSKDDQISGYQKRIGELEATIKHQAEVIRQLGGEPGHKANGNGRRERRSAGSKLAVARKS